MAKSVLLWQFGLSFNSTQNCHYERNCKLGYITLLSFITVSILLLTDCDSHLSAIAKVKKPNVFRHAAFNLKSISAFTLAVTLA
ncbi:hypothetical protein AUQ44_04820 [Vibrio cidicii]|uniref:Uncharacterized protein n=1 Tax=Vibrio cidicii TaxID=1763883 RepID=A0A151JH20_9VIBR|nr:hypothetical protein AUQ44_04820 [Vibrio cidicii]